MDKDVHRTDRQQPFYSEARSNSIKQLRSILLTYVQYNNDLGYCQVGLRLLTIDIAEIVLHTPITVMRCTKGQLHDAFTRGDAA